MVLQNNKNYKFLDSFFLCFAKFQNLYKNIDDQDVDDQ